MPKKPESKPKLKNKNKSRLPRILQTDYSSQSKQVTQSPNFLSGSRILPSNARTQISR